MLCLWSIESTDAFMNLCINDFLFYLEQFLCIPAYSLYSLQPSFVSFADCHKHRTHVLCRSPSSSGTECSYCSVWNGNEDIACERQSAKHQWFSHILQQKDSSVLWRRCQYCVISSLNKVRFCEPKVLPRNIYGQFNWFLKIITSGYRLYCGTNQLTSSSIAHGMTPSKKRKMVK